MTIPATTRQPLHRQIHADRNLQQLCAGLTASTSLVFATLPANGDTLRTADTPPAAVPAAPPPQRTLGELFDEALKAITAQDWQGFITQCGSTVWNAPLDFGQAILVGIYDYVKKQLETITHTASSIVRWAGDAWDCISDIGASGLVDPDTILRSTVCQPFHTIAKGMKAVADVAEQIKALGVSGVLEMVGQFMSGALDLLNDLLHNLLQWLGDRAATIRQWLTDTARDVKALGGLAGSLIASILVEIATSGLGRAAKAVMFVSGLPIPDPDPGVPATTAEGIGESTQAVAMSARGASMEILDELAEVIQKILSAKGPRFTRNMSLKKLRILEKYVPEHKLQKFMSERDKLARAIAHKLEKLRGQVRPYHLSVDEARDFNRRVLAFHYSEALAEGDFNDYFHLLGRRDAILPQVFESNHIVEARMFRSNRWRNEFAQLGWDAETKMDAILLTSAEHTGSARQMFLRQGLSEADIARIAPPNNITRNLLDKIKFRADVVGNPAGVLVIESNTPFSSVFSKYMEVYKADMPDLWNAKLRGQFTTWKNLLNLTVPVP